MTGDGDGDDRIERAKWEAAWPADEPPAGFAERVAGAWQKNSAPRPRRTRTAAALAATVAMGALAACAVGAWLAFAPAASSTGARRTVARESIALGARGVAVAEAGAALSWTVTSRGAEIAQSAGSVFYRVERGGPFVVRTAAGDVRVQGTCFRVEVNPMGTSQQKLLHLGAGAALATAVLVTVYEGRVLLAGEHGQRALAAGERGELSPGRVSGAPEASSSPALASAPTEGMTRDELLARDRQQRQEIERLRAELAGARSNPNGDDGMSGITGKAGKNPFFAPDKDELQAMAKDCRLKWDQPPIGANPETMGPDRAASFGLSDAERLEYNRVMAETNARALAQLRALYLEVTGDKSGAETVTPQALIEEIYDKSNQKDTKDAFYRMSHERAGLQAAPADSSGAPPVERMQRLLDGLGDSFEQDLGRALGPDRAHAMRAQNNGWSSRHVSSYGCPDAN